MTPSEYPLPIHLSLNSMDEIAEINVQIQGIDDQTQKLLEQQTLLLKQRNHLCTRLNSLQSVICTIPEEILAHIFHILTLDQGTHIARTLIRIGAVCTHLRHTAWSAPQLWAEIQLLPGSLNTQESQSRDVAPLLHLYYQNSGGLPVGFTLNSWCTRWCPSQLQIEELMEVVLRKYGHRLRSLTIIPLDASISNALLKRACSDIHLPFLEEVHLSWSMSPIHGDQRLVFHHAPRLSRLSITLSLDTESGVPFSLVFPWHQLSVLRLYGLYPARALEILTNCTRLVEFDFYCAWRPELFGRESIISNTPLAFPHLQRLVWVVGVEQGLPLGDRDNDSSLLENFRFPSLTELIWDGILDLVTSGHSESFFACMEESIKVLNCEHRQMLDFRPVWGKFDYLAELHLRDDGDYSDSETLDCLIVWSGKTWNPLPRLRILDISLEFRTGPTPNDGLLEYEIIGLLYSRCNAPIGSDDGDETFVFWPFDPSSEHWQRYHRLECFTISKLGGGFDWENSGLFDKLWQMASESNDPCVDEQVLHLVW